MWRALHKNLTVLRFAVACAVRRADRKSVIANELTFR
jgi:hypothetical protein